MAFLKPAIFFSAVLSPHLVTAQGIVDEPRYTFDVATISCKQFTDVRTDQLRVRIVYWLDGYYRGSYEPTVIDTETQSTVLAQLADYCAKNESYSLITAYKKLFVVKK
jgi:hypothetical protein